MNKTSEFFSKFPTLFNWPIVALLLLTISACDRLFAPNIATICKENPQYCGDLNSDGWCRAEKAAIIVHRYHYSDNDEQRPKYQQLLNYENYQSCISKAAQIQHIKYREKERGRKQAALSINKKLAQLEWQTRNMEDPYISHFHWSRYNNSAAKARFVAAAKQGIFEEPAFYVDLASITIDEDPDTAKHALFMAIAHYANVEQDIDGRIASQLHAYYQRYDNPRMAYVWRKVSQHFTEATDTAPNHLPVAQSGLNTPLLDRIASDIIAAMEDRDFDAKALKIDHL